MLQNIIGVFNKTTTQWIIVSPAYGELYGLRDDFTNYAVVIDTMLGEILPNYIKKLIKSNNLMCGKKFSTDIIIQSYLNAWYKTKLKY